MRALVVIGGQVAMIVAVWAAEPRKHQRAPVVDASCRTVGAYSCDPVNRSQFRVCGPGLQWINFACAATLVCDPSIVGLYNPCVVAPAVASVSPSVVLVNPSSSSSSALVKTSSATSTSVALSAVFSSSKTDHSTTSSSLSSQIPTTTLTPPPPPPQQPQPPTVKLPYNCISGTYPFNPARIYTIPPSQRTDPYPPILANIDYTLYDWTIDYGPAQYSSPDNGATASLKVSRVNDASGRLVSTVGTRLSTTRYNLYGRFSMRIRAARPAGIVTTFITMSDRGDEIDWEILAADPTRPATTNIFYKRVLEYGEHDTSAGIPGGGVHYDWHEYTIDWTRDRILWLIDGIQVRNETRLARAPDDGHIDPTIRGERYYPSTPSVIQIGIWDGGDLPGAGLSKWAGGPVSWDGHDGFSSDFGALRVVCYDDAGREVGRWPDVDSNLGPR